MDDVKLCAKMKKIGDSNVDNKNIHPGYRNGIWHRKMSYANNERGKRRTNGRNRNSKSGKNQNAWRKGKLQLIGIIRSRHQQTSGDERKNKKIIS